MEINRYKYIYIFVAVEISLNYILLHSLDNVGFRHPKVRLICSRLYDVFLCYGGVFSLSQLLFYNKTHLEFVQHNYHFLSFVMYYLFYYIHDWVFIT
jgi:hypothetical protein